MGTEPKPGKVRKSRKPLKPPQRKPLDVERLYQIAVELESMFFSAKTRIKDESLFSIRIGRRIMRRPKSFIESSTWAAPENLRCEAEALLGFAHAEMLEGRVRMSARGVKGGRA